MILGKDDLTLAKVRYGKKFMKLCVEFMEETGADGINIQLLTMDSTITTDKAGRTCYGKVLNITMDCYDDADDEEED